MKESNHNERVKGEQRREGFSKLKWGKNGKV